MSLPPLIKKITAKKLLVGLFLGSIIILLGSGVVLAKTFATKLAQPAVIDKPQVQTDKEYQYRKAFYTEYSNDKRYQYPEITKTDQSPLPHKQLLEQLMNPIEPIRETNNQKEGEKFRVVSAEPATNDVVTNELRNVKDVWVVGTVALNNNYFTVISYYFREGAFCAQCYKNTGYFRYSFKDNQVINNSGFQELDLAPQNSDQLFFVYNFLESKDLNLDNTPEIILHRDTMSEIGDSGASVRGFSIYRIKGGSLELILNMPITESYIACGRCGDNDGKFFHSDIEFIDQPGSFPRIKQEKKLLYEYPEGETFSSETFYYSYNQATQQYKKSLN